MQQDLLFRFPRTALRTAAAALIVIAGIPAASASSGKDEAIALCKQDLMSGVGAREIRDIAVHYHNNVPYVYGNADFPDASGVHFRCKVFHEKVLNILYLVKDPNVLDGRAWHGTRPRGEVHQEGLQLDEAAIMPPPQNPADPHFQRVP